MRGGVLGLLVLLAGAFQADGQEPAPPPPDASTNPTPAPAPAPVPTTTNAPAPPPITTANPELVRPDQPLYGPLIPPGPAQSVATLEAGGPLPADDPRVASAADLLTQLTARYVEDAPRIAARTVRVVQDIRASNQAASPIEMLVGATQWKGPAGPRGNVPRTFEAFARLYRKWRVEQRKDHATALSQMQPSQTPPAPAP